MEVVRSSDIAWLVLGYLRDNHLEKASKMFCKTSPYLKEEYELMQKGYRSVCLGYGTLSDILREYCEIKSKVVQFIESLPAESKDHFSKQSNLLEKLSVLVKAARRDLVGKIEIEANQTRGVKRRKTVSSDNSDLFETTQEKDLPGYSPPPGAKRRRISQSFLLLTNNKAEQDNANDSSDDDERTTSGSANSHSSEPETIISLSKSHKKKQSAPKKNEELAPKNDIPVPSFPTISETLLENTEFQNKLVAHINKVRSTSSSIEKTNSAKKKPNSDLPPDEIDFHFEEMIQNILNEMEKDPTFHEVVQDILYSRPATNNQATQCSPQQTAPEPVASTSCYEPPLKDRLRSRKSNISADAAVESTENTSLETPGKLCAADSDLKIGSFLTDSNYSFSKLIVLNPNDTMTTSTPLIGDALLASTGNPLLNSYSENVFIDINTGQMSIPLYMASDALFFNTELGQQLADVSLPVAKIVEPSSVERANILPETIAPQSIEENRIVALNAGNVESLQQVTASLDSARILRDKETPLINVPTADMIRSLSTPRRRTSHVRVLNFTSPSNLQGEAGTVPKADVLNEKAIEKAIAVPEPQMHPIVIASGSTEAEAVINDVPLIGQNITVVNESSNSSSNGFAKTSNDVTVVQKNMTETPKRKTEGRRSCARMLSRSGSEENESLLQTKRRMRKQEKKKSSPIKKVAAASKSRPKIVKKPTSVKKTSSSVKKPTSVKKANSAKKSEVRDKMPEIVVTEQLDPLEEWQRMRSIVPAQWDQHLRAISAKSNKGLKPVHSNKKKKRKIGENKPKPSLNTSSSLEDESSAKLNPTSTNSDSASGKNSAKKNLINFKFVTPLKLVKDSKAAKSPGNFKVINEVTLEKIIELTDKPEEGQASIAPTVPAEQNIALEQFKFPQTLLESRDNSMALLLDTPYKTDPTTIPKTPCFLVPGSNDTPITRIMNSFRDNTSMCKNPDLPTPNFAITPGAGMTPIEKETPRSGHWSSYTTDYSSGGSYYKPDESQDLDKHFDSILTAERSKRKFKGKENKAEIKAEVQDIATEESSSHSIVTIISTTNEIREHQIQCPQILEKVPTPKKLTAPPHYTLREGLPEDSKSDVSTSSSSSSSSSGTNSSTSSSSTSNMNDSSDVSWIEPEPIAKEQLLAEDGEIRYPLRSWITPKKLDNAKSTTSVKSHASIHLKNGVDKTKATEVAEKMQLQMSELEAKRLRMKQKLQNDFSGGENKRVAVPAKKTKPAARNARNKTDPLPSAEVASENVTNSDKNDVLRALNLSVKKTERAPSVSSSITTDIFEGEAFPKLRVDEDSKESFDTIEIRNAAYVLTNFSKAAAETAIQKPVDSSELATAIAKIPAKKGRPKKDATKQPAKIFVSPKIYPPHKPVTRRDIRKVHPDETVVPNKTPDILTADELSQKSNDVPKILLEVKARGQSASPKASPNKMSTRSKSVESNISQDQVPKQPENHLSIKQPIVESSSSDQEEDEDPYDACTSITIDENDKLRYHCLSHETLSGRDAKSKPAAVRRANDLSSMIMNIFLEGVPHQLVVTDEIELFGNTPTTRNLKSAAAVINAKKTCRVAASQKKPKVPVTARRKKQSGDEIEPNEPQVSVIPVSPIQPKITIKYKTRTAKDDQIKPNTDKTSPDSTSQSPNSASTSSDMENIPSSSTAPIEAQKPIKIEDINAVLSHLHGM